MPEHRAARAARTPCRAALPRDRRARVPDVPEVQPRADARRRRRRAHRARSARTRALRETTDGASYRDPPVVGGPLERGEQRRGEQQVDPDLAAHADVEARELARALAVDRELVLRGDGALVARRAGSRRRRRGVVGARPPAPSAGARRSRRAGRAAPRGPRAPATGCVLPSGHLRASPAATPPRRPGCATPRRCGSREVLGVLVGEPVDAVEDEERPRDAQRQIALAHVEAQRDELEAAARPGDEDRRRPPSARAEDLVAGSRARACGPRATFTSSSARKRTAGCLRSTLSKPGVLSVALDLAPATRARAGRGRARWPSAARRA